MMFVTKPKKTTTLTLLCLVILALATVSEANDFSPQRRDHADVGRMVRKRSPDLAGIVGLGENPPTSTGSSTSAQETSTSASSTTDTSTSAQTSATSSSQSTSSSSSTSTSSSASTSSSSSTSSASSSSSSATSTSSSNTASSTSNAQSKTDATTSAAQTSQPDTAATQAATPTDTQDDDPTTSQVTRTLTTTSPTSSGATNLSAASSTDKKITKTTLVVLVSIAGSIGFIFVAWTLFRKWKLRPSKNFDDRMAPIDWQPTNDNDDGLPRHRRISVASHGSFQSGNGHDVFAADSGHGHGNTGASPLNPIPDHDFTAGPSTLAPVGGYADLQRGPSPTPQMGELQRGPSMSHQNFDPYGVPAYQGGYDYNNTVGQVRY